MLPVSVRSSCAGGMGLLDCGRGCEVSVLTTLPKFQFVVFWFCIVVAMVICTGTYTFQNHGKDK